MPRQVRHLLAVLAVLALTAAATAADPGTCSNPDAGGAAPKPCGGSASASASSTVTPIEPTKTTPKSLAKAIDGAQGMALLLLHKGDKCAACTAARSALGRAAGALGGLASPLTLDLTASGAPAAATKAAGIEEPAPGVWAILGGRPSDRLAPGDATPAAIARLALDHAGTVTASKLGVESLGGAKASCKCGGGGGGGKAAAASASTSGGCGCGKANHGSAHAKAEARDGRAKASSSKSSSSDDGKDGLPRATSFFGRGTRVRALDADALQALRRSRETAALVAFIAPWCGHCQAAKPELNAAADALAKAGSAGLIAAVDCTTERAACDSAGVRGFPTLRWYGADGREEDYGGARAAAAFEEFVAARAPVPPPEVVQLTSPAVLENACLASRLCLLAVLPHLADSSVAERRAALAAVADAAAPYAGRPYGWLWAGGGDHPELEAALGASYGFPAFVAVVPPSGASPAKVAHFKGAFQASALKAFVEGARAGREAATPVTGELAAADVAEWDGSDAPVEAEADEFSLADLGLA